MITDEIKAKLIEWMTNFVEVPNPSLGDWAPCPYAKQARLRDKISIRFTDNIIAEARSCLADLILKDVVVICFDHTKISAKQLEYVVDTLNAELMPDDFVILEDHPDIPESINGVPMNFGHCGLLVIQKMSKLKTASDQLKEKGYYDVWSQEDIDFVVSWRDNG